MTLFGDFEGPICGLSLAWEMEDYMGLKSCKIIFEQRCFKKQGGLKDLISVSILAKATFYFLVTL